jgi:hypothetical protein
MSTAPPASATRMKAIASVPDADGLRCVDILLRADGQFSFREFRRDPEDAGRWTLTGDYADRIFKTREDALQAAGEIVPWLRAAI